MFVDFVWSRKGDQSPICLKKKKKKIGWEIRSEKNQIPCQFIFGAIPTGMWCDVVWPTRVYEPARLYNMQRLQTPTFLQAGHKNTWMWMQDVSSYGCLWMGSCSRWKPGLWVAVPVCCYGCRDIWSCVFREQTPGGCWVFLTVHMLRWKRWQGSSNDLLMIHWSFSPFTSMTTDSFWWEMFSKG